MPTTPSFIQVRDWIREASELLGQRISARKAKSLAGAYLATAQRDPDWYSRLTYDDPVGEYVAARWASMFHRMEAA